MADSALCYYRCMRFLFIALVIVTMLAGAGLIACGTWFYLVQPAAELLEAANRFNNTVAYIFIISGIVVIFLTILGCCSGWRESSCLIATFFSLLLILFFIFVGAACYAVHAREQMKREVKAHVLQSVDHYYVMTSDQKFMDRVQAKLHCCGVSQGSVDYGQEPTPRSCNPLWYKHPCVPELVPVHDLLVFGAVAVSASVLFVVDLVVAMVLCCATRRMHV